MGSGLLGLAIPPIIGGIGSGVDGGGVGSFPIGGGKGSGALGGGAGGPRPTTGNPKSSAGSEDIVRKFLGS